MQRLRVLSPVERSFCIATVCITFCDQLLVGGSNNELALIIAAIGGALLLTATVVFKNIGKYKLFPLFPSSAYFLLLFYLFCPLLSVILDDRATFLQFRKWDMQGASNELIEILKLFSLIAPFLIGSILNSSRSRGNFTFRCVVFAGAIYSTLSFLTYVMWPGTVMGFGNNQFPERLTASFLSPNTAGCVFGILIILGIAASIGPITYIRQQFLTGADIQEASVNALTAFLLLISSLVCLLLTSSRSATASTAICSILFILAEAGGRRWPLKVTALLIAISVSIGFAAILGSAGTRIIERLGNVASESGSRILIMKTHAAQIRSHLSIGSGLGSFPSIHKHLLTPQNYDELWNIKAMHNVYLQWSEESGLPSVILLISFCVSLMYLSLKDIHRGVEGGGYAAAAGFGALLLYIQGITDFALQDYSITWFLALLLGFSTMLYRHKYLALTD